jgi:ABC-type nitrate/sulfonate/bicarbonate transport system ATPase subunit
MFTFGELKLDNYSEYLDSLTKQDMQERVRQMIYESEPAVVY